MTYINNSILDEPIPEIGVPIMRFTHRPVFPKISSVWMLFVSEHGRQKALYKDCGGSQICGHNKRKDICKDCGDSQICEHQKVRWKCKECKRK